MKHLYLLMRCLYIHPQGVSVAKTGVSQVVPLIATSVEVHAGGTTKNEML